MGFQGRIPHLGVTPKNFTHLNHTRRGASLSTAQPNRGQNLARHMDGRRGRTYYVGQGPAPKGRPDLAIQKAPFRPVEEIVEPITANASEVQSSSELSLLGRAAAFATIPPALVGVVGYATSNQALDGALAVLTVAMALGYSGLTLHQWGKNPEKGGQFDMGLLVDRLADEIELRAMFKGKSMMQIEPESRSKNRNELIREGVKQLVQGETSMVIESLMLSASGLMATTLASLADFPNADPVLMALAVALLSGSGYVMARLDTEGANAQQA